MAAQVRLDLPMRRCGRMPITSIAVCTTCVLRRGTVQTSSRSIAPARAYAGSKQAAAGAPAQDRLHFSVAAPRGQTAFL